MGDRIKFILNTSSEYFNANAYKEDSSFIEEFLTNNDIQFLGATSDDGKISFHHKIPTNQTCLLFYKIPKSNSNTTMNLNEPGEHLIGMLTLEGGMTKSMYNSVSRVFSAGLKRSEYTPEIATVLDNLQTLLNSQLGLPQSGISSVQDEINFWNKTILNSSTKQDREQAQGFASILEKLNEQVSKINQHSLHTVEEFLDSSHNHLDELWHLMYPQNRMSDLMDVLCNFLTDICVDNLQNENIWNLSSFHINNLMSQAIDLTDSWIQLCDTLTRLFWPNYSKHPWSGKPHIPKRGELFKERLSEIKNIKNLFKQIVTLLNGQDIREMFNFNTPFQAINIFDTTPGGQMKWNKALSQFEKMLCPIDERIALAIKYQLQNNLSNPRQVMFIFSKYDTLIQRPTVLDLLTIEREQFLQSLQILLQDLRKAMNDTNMEPDTGYLSTICNECRWLKIVEYQISEIEKVSHLISGREGFDKMNKSVQELKEEVETLLRTNFEIWSEQTLSAVKSGELKLREDQNVVEFEKEGRQLMRVTFNPKLVTFCHDIREFENLGYRIPTEMKSVASHTAKFMSYARRLQQIATFHNTIGDRMIPCQRPIMLKNAKQLSKLVKSESVAWNDEESVQRYVNVLQKAVSKLSADNNLLVGYHEQIKRTVMKLMNTDLLSQGQTWKDEMRHLRELVANLERQGYTNLNIFCLHWDHQLYKALEYQYILGLIDMNNKLPDIRIDIVFRQRQLQFRPPEEEIRVKYFSQLRRFIERPLGFRGLSENSNELFKIMVERNRHHLGSLYRKAEDLFKKLEELKGLWMPWIALGCVDVEELCNVHLQKWEQWDRNFKACKYFSQQIAKLPNSEETIDCFVVNVLPLRSDIEFINRRYWEALASSLKVSILNDISVIQEFLQNSFQFLQNVPMDEASIAESGIKYEKITKELPKINDTLLMVKGKDTCLAGWCKERVSALSGILTQWEKLQPLIENHSAVLQRQIDIMKDHVKIQIFNLKNEVEKFMLRFESTLSELENNVDVTNLDLFQERQQSWKSLQEKIIDIKGDCQKYNIDFPEDIAEIFEKAEDNIQRQSQQWEIYDSFLTEMEEVTKEEWAIYRRRPYFLTEFISKWESTINCSIDISSSRIRQKVQCLQDVIPILHFLQSDSLTERHWARIFQILGIESKPMHTLLLKDVIQNVSALEQASSEIQSIVRKASSEQIVRQAINELDQWAVTAQFKIASHLDSFGIEIPLIKDYQEVLNKIGDNQSLLQSAKNSAAFDAFSDQADLWEDRLNSLENLLTKLLQSQRKWIYLEPVFSSGTLKNEEALFKRLDKDFRYIMREINNDSRIMSLLKINNINSITQALENQLTRCQTTLMSYITEKRNIFPRFYFLSDDDLLELLGQASKEDIIQKHIKKLFPGINKLGIKETNSGSLNIEFIQSSEGDIVKLIQKVNITNTIETWLSELLMTVRTTLKNQIIKCFQKNTEITKDVIEMYPVQVICTARALHFTKQTEKAMTSLSLANILKLLNDEINKFAILKNSINNNLLELKLKAILLDLVHYKNIVEELISNNVTNSADWTWLQQLKFFLDKDSNVIIRMAYAEFDYSYEYLGNSNKLVYTSLTHKCFLTLTQAMNMGLGGNPFGPAGTGKTESVKALGSLLGRLVLVFNCDENIDTQAMNLILTGLALCGAWGCFDEFNRLQEHTLSAISMLIQPIQCALKDKLETVQVMEKNIKLDQHCGIFVTLNPAGENYGGRQQLPGNIQALFRPIVMQQSEPIEIARNLLFVEGFHYANEIANRLVELFELALQKLSPQKHYDWGLRELKTILISCGKEHKDSAALDNELKVVVNVLQANTVSKLTIPDSRSFKALLGYIFPEVEIASNVEHELKNFIEKSFEELNLFKNQKQFNKVQELQEQLSKRMGVVVVGPPSSGKTTIISILKQSLASSGKQIRVYQISPKSMNRVQLLGKLDQDTRQWIDGVLTQTAVTVNSAEKANINSWIICDGDIDPEWIEALNSVLDDNRLLSLPSGWRIQFGNNVNFIFETHSLAHASPATISRMGIINLSSEDLDMNIQIEHFISFRENGDYLRNFIDQYVYKALDIAKGSIEHYEELKASLIRDIIRNISNCNSKEHFCVNLIGTLMNFVSFEEHNELANRLYENFDIYISDPTRAEVAYYNEAKNAISFYQMDSHTDGSELIKTPHIQTYLNILRKFLEKYQPFLVIGPSGTGKSILIKEAVSEFSGYQFITINCSKQINANYVLHMIKQNTITVSGNRGRECKPLQQKIIMFFKNIDLLFHDSWGSSEVIEFLLQLIQRKGFYSENLEWISISRLQICCSVTNFETANQKLSSRFMCLNNYLRVKYPSDNDLLLIVRNKLQVAVKSFKSLPNLQYIEENLVKLFIRLNEKIGNNRVHFNYTPKALVKVIENLEAYNEDFFSEALLTEINVIFRSRLCTQDELDEFDDIMYNSLGALIKSVKMDMYFVSKNIQCGKISSVTSEEWNEIVQKSITVCNSETFLIESPITEELLQQTAYVSRILSRPNSHMVIVSTAGSEILDSIYVSMASSSKILVPQGIKNYSMPDFYNDLKMAMQIAALEDVRTIFLIDHCWLIYLPDIMKPIEAIFERCEILDLFGDDLESLANPLKTSAQLEGYQDSLASYFLKKATKNLHLILLLNSEADKMNEIFNNFPTFYRNTELIWDLPPSNSTLNTLPIKLIKNLSDNKEEISIPGLFSKIIEYEAVNLSSQTLKQMIKSYYFLHKNLLNENNEHSERLRAGVNKLADAYRIVDELKENAHGQEEALAEKRKLANEALEMISSTMRNANDQKTDLLELKTKTQESSKRLQERQKVIAEELSEVEPILKEASAAVGQIKTEALSEIRSLRAPPETIRDILEGVLRLMGTRDTSWNSMKSFLAKRGVKEDIKSLDPGQISPENCQAVEKLLETKSDSFDVRNAKRASVAAAPLATWVIANVKYSKVMQSIKPLEQEQKQLQRNLLIAENEIKSLSSGLNDVDDRVKELSNQLNKYTQEAAILEIKLEEARNTLKSAEILVEKLSSEYVTWNHQLKSYEDEKKVISENAFWISLIINAFLDLTIDKRKILIEQISSEVGSKHFEITEKLINDQDQVIWEGMGLNRDTQALENAVFLVKIIHSLPFGTYPIPLIVDPTESAFKWLQQYLSSINKSFEIISINSNKISYQLELAVRFGKIFMIEGGDEMIPPVLPLIFNRIYSKFNKKMLQVGNKLVEFHDDFKLILFTKMSNIEVPSEIKEYITKINFTITSTGLTDQLLSKLILQRKPELESKRLNILESEADLLQKRKDLENKLLKELSISKGDILKNTKLILTLNEVKESSSKIDSSLKESLEIKSSIFNEYNQYRYFCSQAANFFVNIRKIYDISLKSYLKLYGDSLKICGNIEDEKIYKHLVKQTYQFLCRSTPKLSHLTLGLQLSRSSYPDQISDIEWELFVTNFAIADEKHESVNHIPSWIKSELSPKLIALASALPSVFNTLQLDNESIWTNILQENSIKDIPLPLTKFQKLLIIQIFRPELMAFYMDDVINSFIGVKPELVSQITMEKIIEESSNTEPILLVTESGNDPSEEIRQHLNKISKLSNYVEVSVGPGMDVEIIDKIKNYAESGKWVCVKNVHLMPQMLIKMDRALSTITSNNDFRLWLITDTTKNLPENITYKYTKVLYESPSGLKNKTDRLLRHWNSTTKMSTKLNSKSNKLNIIFFILNSVVQERQNYIPQGWSKLYDFNDSDMKSGLEVLKLFDGATSGQANKFNWKILHGMLKIIAYGGRIENPKDLEILEKLFTEFFNDTSIGNKWSPLKFNVNIPNLDKISDYYDIIKKLPDSDAPEHYGFSRTSDLFRNMKYCKNIIQSLRSFYYNDNSEIANESLDKRIKPLLSLWKKLANGSTIDKTAFDTKSVESEMPWKDFLISELKLAALLFKEIHTTLVRAHLILKQAKNLNDAYNSKTFKALAENQVPISWKLIWSGPKTAFEYIRAFISRAIETEKRYKSDYHLTFCDAIDVTTIFNVSSFIASLKLCIANENQKPSSKLTLISGIKKIVGPVVVKINSVRVDGADFVSDKLVIFNKSTNNQNKSLEFFITYVENKEGTNNYSGTTSLPLYSNIMRDVHICNLSVPTNENDNDIILSGAAFYISDLLQD